MSLHDLTKILGEYSPAARIAYLPNDITKVKIFYGVPPVPIVGLDYVFAHHVAPRTKLFKCLTGGGVFAANNNQGGIIEIGLMRGSLSCGGIQLMQLTGIPFPIKIDDLSSGGTSFVVGSACQLTGTPEWRRERFTGLSVYTFQTPRLMISHGIQLPDIVS